MLFDVNVVIYLLLFKNAAARKVTPWQFLLFTRRNVMRTGLATVKVRRWISERTDVTLEVRTCMKEWLSFIQKLLCMLQS